MKAIIFTYLRTPHFIILFLLFGYFSFSIMKDNYSLVANYEYWNRLQLLIPKQDMGVKLLSGYNESEIYDLVKKHSSDSIIKNLSQKYPLYTSSNGVTLSNTPIFKLNNILYLFCTPIIILLLVIFSSFIFYALPKRIVTAIFSENYSNDEFLKIMKIVSILLILLLINSILFKFGI